MSWLLAESEPVTRVAILAQSDYLPWRSAKVCFENQADFEYLEERHLRDGTARVDSKGVRIRGRRYEMVVVEQPERADPRALKALERLKPGDRRVDGVLSKADLLNLRADVRLHGSNGTDAAGIRYRRMRQGQFDLYFLFNEGEATFNGVAVLPEAGMDRWQVDPHSAKVIERVFEPVRVNLEPHQSTLLITTGPPA
jgi:hypothetical protein